MLTDDLTSFLGANPSNSKDADTVVEAVHRYDDAVPAVRRWWSDRAPEFLSAARYIRTLRPLAHFTSVPWRHAPKAERTNRTCSEGTRAALIHSGLSEAWWPLALLFWVALWNGFMTGTDGMAPYTRRHHCATPYRQWHSNAPSLPLWCRLHSWHRGGAPGLSPITCPTPDLSSAEVLGSSPLF